MVKPLTPQQMVEPRAFAPFEVQEVMVEWCRRWDASEHKKFMGLCDAEQAVIYQAQACNGLGAPFRVGNETPEGFGFRVATAIFTLIKEI